jgi:GT2 family glycosyltransferase
MIQAASGGEDVDFISSNLGIAANRNRACKELLDSTDEYLWMIDSDVIPPYPLSGNERCLSGVYHHYLGGAFSVTYSAWTSNGNGKYCGLLELPKNRFAVQGVGAGCLRVHRSLLEDIGPPWFEDHVSKDFVLEQGEDFDFCEKVIGIGEKIWVDPDCLCHHLQTISIKTFLQSEKPIMMAK